MPVTYLGLPSASGANAKVLESSEYQKEQNGLETLVENYTLRSANRISLQPARNALHKAYSTADIKYPRMMVEQVGFREQTGGITKMSVTYVGLTSSSGLPAPIVRLLPVEGQIFIEAEYITDENENSLINLSNTTRMPATLNGYPMPPNPAVFFSIYNASAGYVRELGYCYDQTQCVRRGLFLVVRATFRRKRFGIGVYAGLTNI
jgi:hypothetical protein